MISLEFPPEALAIKEGVRKFVDEFIIPAEKEIGLNKKTRAQIVKELQPRARKEGIWCTMLPKEAGGMGLSPLENAMVMVELSRSSIGPWVANSEGPDDATMVTLWERGTPEQKEKYLKPLVNGEARICFAMTEKETGGSDATGLRTFGVRQGDNWVINGEKAFAGNANIAKFCLLMVKTSTEGPRHKQFSSFLVNLPDPGFRIKRIIPLIGRSEEDLEPDGGGSCEIEIKDLVVPHKNILGGEGEGFDMGQLRLGYGRLRHGFNSIATAQKALDLAVGRVITRTTFGQPLAERQGVLWMLADCARDLYIGRLMVLHIAYLIQQKKDFSQENHVVKVFLANMVHKCVDTAIQLYGAYGITRDTPLADLYMAVRAQRFVDGPDEVHRWRAGANLVKAYRQYGTTSGACGGALGI